MSLVRHFVTLVSGRLISQIVLVISTPILTRLYAPEDFGLVSLVSSITQIPLIYLLGRIDQAIPQSKDDEEAGRLASLALCFALGMTTLCFSLGWLGRDWLATRYNQPVLPIILLSSISIFMLTAFAQVGKQWAAYRERHGVTASADVLLAVTRRGTPIPLYSLMGAGPWPLFIGQALGVLMGSLTFVTRLGRDVARLTNFSPRALWATLKEYKNFPLFLGTTSLLEVSMWSLLSVMIGDFFGVAAIGWFGQAYALLFLPISLMNQSSTNIFYPRLAKARDNPKELGRLLKTMVNLSFDFSWYPLLILLPISPQFWGTLLGEKFYMSGELAQVLIPMGIISIIFSPVSVIVNVFHRQHAFFIQALALNISRGIALYFGCHSGSLIITIGSFVLATIPFKFGQLIWVLGIGGVSLRGLISGFIPKTIYVFSCMGLIHFAQSTYQLTIIPLLLLATLGMFGWCAFVIKYNEDARNVLNRFLSKRS